MLLLLPALLGGGGSLAYAAEVDEYTLKAVLFLKLSHFVYWPDRESRGGQRTLCVVEPDPFGNDLRNAAAAATPPRQVRRLASVGEWSGCDQIFIGRQHLESLQNLVQQLSGQGVLTVSDIPGFAAAGGMVELTLEGARVGVAINRDVARAHGLDFNAQLLKLARLITP